ncbi:unnamed protein product [Brassica rapa subsp. narinosa]|nr:putative transmembrane protein At3g54730 [Brassica napus]
MGLMLLFRGSESLLLLPPPPEPPPFVFPLDLLAGVSAPDPPDPPDASVTLVTLDLSSFPCHCFTLAAARSPLHCTTTSDSVCLLIVSLGVNLVKPLLLPTDGYRFQIYNFIWGKIRFFFLFLGRTWKGMTLVIRLDVSIWDGTYLRFGFLVLRIRNHSRTLPQYEDLMLLGSHCLTQYEAVRHLFCLPLPQYEVHLPQYEVHLPQYEVHLPRHEVVVRNIFLGSLQYICVLVVFSDVSGLQLKKISDGFKKANLGFVVSDLFVWPWWFLQLYTSLWLWSSSQFQGSSRWCLITSVAKFLAALYAFVAAACSGNSSLNVFSNSRGFISLSSIHGVSLLSCLCVMFAFIYVCVIRFAFAAVYLANVAVLLFLLNNSSIDGV